jgi:hypothetical protein
MKKCRYVFVLGTGRMGSLSLAKTFAMVKGIRATHEKFPNARHISNRLWDNEISKSHARKLIIEGLNKFEHCSVWFESNCLLWNFIDLLDREVNGEAIYIYVKRNRDNTIQSLFNTGFCAKGKLPWSDRAHRGFISIDKPDYDDDDRLYNCELCYDIRTNEIENSLDKIEYKRKMTVSFEEMTSLPITMKRIYEFVTRATGVDIDDDLPLVKDHHPGSPF